jgi:hypothetical protein
MNNGDDDEDDDEYSPLGAAIFREMTGMEIDGEDDEEGSGKSE